MVCPLSYLCLYSFPSLKIETSSHSESAFTTDAPTPWSPPDTLYPPPPNLPPAWRMVNTTSTAGIPALWLIPTGIPLPLSTTVIELSGLIVTWISVQNPASASSTALSTISYTRWCRPLLDVLPMYIPGLFLTASSPSRIWIWSAPYSVFSPPICVLLSFYIYGINRHTEILHPLINRHSNTNLL